MEHIMGIVQQYPAHTFLAITFVILAWKLVEALKD